MNNTEYGLLLRSDRAVIAAEYIIKHNCTVRDAAGALGISKSTVHKDVTEKLADCDAEMFVRVREILEKNKSERHLRGGLATKQKYLAIRSVKESML